MSTLRWHGNETGTHLACRPRDRLHHRSRTKLNWEHPLISLVINYHRLLGADMKHLEAHFRCNKARDLLDAAHSLIAYLGADWNKHGLEAAGPEDAARTLTEYGAAGSAGLALPNRCDPRLPACRSYINRYAGARAPATAIIAAVCPGGVMSTSVPDLSIVRFRSHRLAVKAIPSPTVSRTSLPYHAPSTEKTEQHIH